MSRRGKKRTNSATRALENPSTITLRFRSSAQDRGDHLIRSAHAANRSSLSGEVQEGRPCCSGAQGHHMQAAQALLPRLFEEEARTLRAALESGALQDECRLAWRSGCGARLS